MVLKLSLEIHWNGFIDHCIKNYPNEACAFLFADKPFNFSEEWFVFPVDNVAEDKRHFWEPDKSQLRKIKQKAKGRELTNIGNIHSHPVNKNEIKSFDTFEDYIEYLVKPSPGDLQYAKKFNNIVRGILVVDDKIVLAHLFHDQFGNRMDIYINGLNKRPVELGERNE